MNLLRAFVFAILTGTALAQTDPPPTREVTLRLLAFDANSIPPESFAHDPASPQPGPGVSAPIKSYLNHEVTNLKLFGNTVVFSSTAQAKDPKAAELEFAKVLLPNIGNRLLLIFLPAAKGKFKVFVLDDSVKAFPLGSYQVFNLSHLPVRLTLENKPFDFKPGQDTLISDPPVQENQHSAMYAFVQADGKWQRIGAGLWPHPGKKRSIQIFFDNPESQQTELRGFRDIAPPPVTPPKPDSP